MHQTDEQRPHREPLRVFVRVTSYVVDPFAVMGMSVKVDFTVGVVMEVKVDTLLNQPTQHVHAQQNQHDAHSQFE